MDHTYNFAGAAMAGGAAAVTGSAHGAGSEAKAWRATLYLRISKEDGDR